MPAKTTPLPKSWPPRQWGVRCPDGRWMAMSSAPVWSGTKPEALAMAENANQDYLRNRDPGPNDYKAEPLPGQ